MDAQQERLEVEAVRSGNDDLTIDDAALGQVRLERRWQLGEVAVERLQVSALDEHLIAVAEDDRAKAVPFRLEQPAVGLRNVLGELGQHWFERRLERQVHGGDSSGAAAGAAADIVWERRWVNARRKIPRRSIRRARAAP